MITALLELNNTELNKVFEQSDYISFLLHF
jgi:hypothetical protein